MGGESTRRWGGGSLHLAVGQSVTHVTSVPIIHIVDDDPSFSTAMARLLRLFGYHVALHESATKFLEAQPIAASGCILLDVQMPGLSGLQLQYRLIEQGCMLPIIFMTSYGDIPMSVEAVKAGAEDFLSKPISKATLLEVVQRAVLRSDAEREQHNRLCALRELEATLTPRESQVFALVVRGKRNKQIAHELGASERTIKIHRHNMMHKLRAQSLAELVSIADRLAPSHREQQRRHPMDRES